MALRSFLIVFLLSAVLVATTIDGRKGPVEYWNEMTGGQPLPEAIKKDFIIYGSTDPKEKTLPDAHLQFGESVVVKESAPTRFHFHNANDNSIIKDFDPAHFDPSLKLVRYLEYDAANPDKKSIIKDFDPAHFDPSLKLLNYVPYDVVNPVKKSIIKDFDPDHFDPSLRLLNYAPYDVANPDKKSIVKDFDPAHLDPVHGVMQGKASD